MTTRFDKFDKLNWLLNNCTTAFITDRTILHELVTWMNENDFSLFLDHKCSEWNIDHPFGAYEDEDA